MYQVRFFASVETFSGSFLFYFYFYVPYFGLTCDHENSFLCLEDKSKKQKVLDRGKEGLGEF